VAASRQKQAIAKAPRTTGPAPPGMSSFEEIRENRIENLKRKKGLTYEAAEEKEMAERRPQVQIGLRFIGP